MNNNEPDYSNAEPGSDIQDLIDAAIHLQKQGMNVIPLRTITPQAKRPFLAKGELKDAPGGFFHRKSTIEDIMEWQQRDAYSKKTGSDWRWAGLAIITGETSGIFVAESDSEEGERVLQAHDNPEETWKASSGRGFHRYYRIPQGMEIPTHLDLLPGIDIKGQKGYAACSPSLHHSGKRYKWINSPSDTPLADPPAWLINTIKLALGEGLTTEEEYSTVPQEVVDHLRERKPKRSSGGFEGSASDTVDPFEEKIPCGHRNNVLFRRACSWRYQGYEEEQIHKELRAHNELYCEPDQYGELLSDEELANIARSACQYKKGNLAPLEVLKAIEAVSDYYRQYPAKGMAAHTDKDITEALLEEALKHCSVGEDGIEVSISHASLALKAGVTTSTLNKALQERLFSSGRLKKGKNPEGTKSGSLILVTSQFYATSGHSTSGGESAPSLHKAQIHEVRSRWGKNHGRPSRLGKICNNILRSIEEADELRNREFTPKEICEKLNEGVTDPEKMVKSTSISRHLAKMCRVGILTKVRRGVYRLDEDRYKKLEFHMLVSGELESAYKQRARSEKRRKAYKQYLDSLGVIDGEELDPEVIEKIMEWNKTKDWKEIEPYVLANKLGISIREAFKLCGQSL